MSGRDWPTEPYLRGSAYIAGLRQGIREGRRAALAWGAVIGGAALLIAQTFARLVWP